MKKTGIFLGGFATGVVVTFVVLLIIGLAQNPAAFQGVTNFEEQGDIVHEKSFEVMRVIADNAALVHGKKYPSSTFYLGTLYLLRNNEGKYYYDDEIIKVPVGKVVRQTGIYKYQTKSEDYKTVPIIEIVDK
jgi:hypothetical protein